MCYCPAVFTRSGSRKYGKDFGCSHNRRAVKRDSQTDLRKDAQRVKRDLPN